jgi:REP element-mobilizing transposase RayT
MQFFGSLKIPPGNISEFFRHSIQALERPALASYALLKLFYEIVETHNFDVWVMQSMPDDAHGFGSARKK